MKRAPVAPICPPGPHGAGTLGVKLPAEAQEADIRAAAAQAIAAVHGVDVARAEVLGATWQSHTRDWTVAYRLRPLEPEDGS